MKHLIFTSLIWLALLSGAQAQQLNHLMKPLQWTFRYKMTEHLPMLWSIKQSLKPVFRVKNDNKSLLNDFTVLDTKTTTFDENWNQFGVK
jgi:hypothetical protein